MYRAQPIMHVAMLCRKSEKCNFRNCCHFFITIIIISPTTNLPHNSCNSREFELNGTDKKLTHSDESGGEKLFLYLSLSLSARDI